MACHVDDIIRPRHDVEEVLFIHETGIHGVIVALGEGQTKRQRFFRRKENVALQFKYFNTRGRHRTTSFTDRLNSPPKKEFSELIKIKASHTGSTSYRELGAVELLEELMVLPQRQRCARR